MERKTHSYLTSLLFYSVNILSYTYIQSSHSARYFYRVESERYLAEYNIRITRLCYKYIIKVPIVTTLVM